VQLVRKFILLDFEVKRSRSQYQISTL